MIDISKVVLFELDVVQKVCLEHAGEGADRALKNDSFYVVTSCIDNYWKCSKTEAPKDYLIKRFFEPSQY